MTMSINDESTRDKKNNDDKKRNNDAKNNDDTRNNDKIGDANDQGAANDDPFAPAKLRLSQDFAAGQAVKKILTKVPVRKPDRHWFFRVRPGEEWRLAAAIIENKEDREIYLVDPTLATALAAEVVLVMLFTCITRHGVVFLLPIRLPGADGRHNEWHRSTLEAAQRAETRWIRLVANMEVGAYEVFEALGALPEPEWPDYSFAELLRIAFQDRFIRTADHPMLRRLRGEV
jgi:hypothetical protein